MGGGGGRIEKDGRKIDEERKDKWRKTNTEEEG